MMLLGDVCMISHVFFVEYFLSLLIGPFFPDHSRIVWSIGKNTSRWDVSCIPMHSCWRSLYTPNEFFGWNNWYRGSNSTIHLIINVGPINQPYLKIAALGYKFCLELSCIIQQGGN
jgi:hypothetical protein